MFLPNDTLKLNEIFLILTNEMSMLLNELNTMIDEYCSNFDKSRLLKVNNLIQTFIRLFMETGYEVFPVLTWCFRSWVASINGKHSQSLI